MATSDQHHQNVTTQYNADQITISQPGMTGRDRHRVGIALVVGLVAVLPLGVVLMKNLPGGLPRPPEAQSAPVAQTLSGMIWDDDHYLLAGVTVILADFNRTTTTDQHGRFMFAVTAPKERSVKLIARKDGYTTHDAYATLGNPAFNFIMRKAP